MVEVRAIIRDTELRFAKPGGKFGDSSGYDGRAAGATFLLSSPPLNYHVPIAQWRWWTR